MYKRQWKNSSAGLFVSTDGGKTWGYGWESDDTAVETAILLEQNLKELDDRYKKATELSEELLKELDDRYKTATALSSELQEQLDQRYETAKKLSKEPVSYTHLHPLVRCLLYWVRPYRPLAQRCGDSVLLQRVSGFSSPM